jgi:hypothetical protein
MPGSRMAPKGCTRLGFPDRRLGKEALRSAFVRSLCSAAVESCARTVVDINSWRRSVVGLQTLTQFSRTSFRLILETPHWVSDKADWRAL